MTQQVFVGGIESLQGGVLLLRLANQVELSVDVLNRSVADLHPAGMQIGLQLEMSTLRQVA